MKNKGNDMENQDIQEVKALIRQEITGYARFSNKKYGDTPTDALQLVPRKYTDGIKSSVFASVQAGLTITGNLKVGGSASVVGNLSLKGSDIPAIFIGATTGLMAAGTPFPSGWTASLVSAGNCLITHNLGTSSYVPQATSQSTNATILSRNSNDFTIQTLNSSSVATTDVAYFSVFKI